VDANGGWRHGWREIKDMPAALKTGIAVSVGYVLADDEKEIVVCPHLVADRGAPWSFGDGEIAIPKDWVQKITPLTVKRGKR